MAFKNPLTGTSFTLKNILKFISRVLSGLLLANILVAWLYQNLQLDERLL